MCKQDKTWEERVEGAETLAYLIEVDVQLQRIAAISDHLINTLAEYFKYPGSPMDATLMPKVKVSSWPITGSNVISFPITRSNISNYQIVALKVSVYPITEYSVSHMMLLLF